MSIVDVTMKRIMKSLRTFKDEQVKEKEIGKLATHLKKQSLSPNKASSRS